jgi:hypothetical protein
MSDRGALLELVARGKKDAFFTNNPKVSFFHSVYRKYAAFTEEVHITAPRNNPEWGKWLEFELEHRGDLVRKAYLRIELPTWLPASIAAQSRTTRITDLSGVSYGYCNNIGFQVIEKIQLLQDQVILQETYGEYLDWRLRQTNKQATTFVIAGSVGTRGESVLDISRSAVPGMLRVPLSIIGWENVGDPGFPTVALRNQRFRIRILLRPLDQVVVASDGRLKPEPWGKTFRIQSATGVETFQTLPYESLAKGIILSLETTQVYVPCDVQEWLKSRIWRIPYKTAQHMEFHVADNQMNAAATAVANFALPFTLDFSGPATRMLVGLQRTGDRLAGQRTFLLSDAVRQFRLNINNLDRIQPFYPEVFRDVTAYWKNVRAAGDLADPTKPQEVYTFVFGGIDTDQPYGTLNFTRALEPIFWILFGVVPVDVRTQSRELFVVTNLETFRIWEIEGGKGICLIDE